MELQGYENIKIDLVAQFNFNNSLLGDHGQKNFYEGLSKCEDINEPEKCFCFYLPIKQSFYSEPAADLYYFIPDAMMLMLKSYIYPDCGTINTTFLFQGLVPTTYPETTLSLAGRHHLTNTSYSITSWLKNYEDLDPLGTTSKTMDPLESIKGFTDYTTIDMGESYQGYVPGTI
ncbi:MAG: hypothetical protein WCQ47_08390 [bacterium]